MKSLAKILFTGLLLTGIHVAAAQTTSKSALPPYYTGVIDYYTTHTQVGEKHTKRNKPIHSFKYITSKNKEDVDVFYKDESNIALECIDLVGMLDGAWRVPGVIHVNSYQPYNTSPRTTLILRAYDAVFTVNIPADRLDRLRDAGGWLEANKTRILLKTNDKVNMLALASDSHTHDDGRFGYACLPVKY